MHRLTMLFRSIVGRFISLAEWCWQVMEGHSAAARAEAEEAEEEMRGMACQLVSLHGMCMAC